MKFLNNIIFIYLSFSFSSLCLAQDLRSFVESNVDPLRTVREVQPKVKAEKVYQLKGPKVLIADYELIKRDFSFLASVDNNTIDQWLIQEAGYISIAQAEQEVTNSAIAVNRETQRVAHRPPEYGRALVYEAHDFSGKKVGVLDVKGAGSLKPSMRAHGTGVMTLGESLREFSFEKLITTVVNHSGIDQRVVGAYAVLYPGFDAVHSDGSRSAAGLYIRQGHRRYTKAENKIKDKAKGLSKIRGNGWMDSSYRNKYESLLKQYGIFANENYQGTVKNDLFDFGHYIVRNDLPSPNDAIKVSFKEWGFDLRKNESIFTTADRWKFSKRDRPWIWSHDTAKAFVEGRANRHHVWMNHYNLLHTTQENLKAVPRTYNHSKKIGFKIKLCEQQFNLR